MRLMNLPCTRKNDKQERLDHLAEFSKEKMTLTWKGVHRRLAHGTWTLVKINYVNEINYKTTHTRLENQQ